VDQLVEDLQDFGGAGLQGLVDVGHRDGVGGVTDPGRRVHDQGDGGIPEPRLGGEGDLGNAGHAGDVGAGEPGQPDLGTGLEARALEAGVDPAVADRVAGRGCGLEDLAADGRVVYFSQYKIGKWVIERISTEGGEPEQVSDVSVDLWSISPDGKRVAYSFFDEKLGRWQIAVRALEGNDSIVQLDVAAYDLLTWTPDSNSLIYKDATSPELSPPLWRQPLNGDKPQPFIAATPETNYWLDWSSDRKQLAFVRGREVINMVMLTRSDRVAKLSGH